jgi:uncharacterized protein
MLEAIICIVFLFLLYKGFTIDLELSGRRKRILLLLFLGGILFLIIIGGIANEPVIFLRFPLTWVGVLGITFTYYLISTGISLIFPNRRPGIVFGSLVILILVTVYSIFNGIALPRVKELTIPNSKLPGKLSGFTIVQLSDLHLGGVLSPSSMKKIVEQVNGLHPDIVVITGDMVEGLIPIESWEPFTGILQRLKSKNGVIAVTGNHDLVRGWRNFSRFANECHITVLSNESVTIEGAIQIVGITDPRGINYKIGGPDLSKAFKNIDRSKPVILLSHRPDYFDAARGYGVDLQLSGHTHAGQIPPMDLIVHWLYSYPCGLYHRENSYIYTSSGVSVMEVPMRLFSYNEIVKIRLVKNK